MSCNDSCSTVAFIIMIVVVVGMMGVVFSFEYISRYLVVVGLLVVELGRNVAFHT